MTLAKDSRIRRQGPEHPGLAGEGVLPAVGQVGLEGQAVAGIEEEGFVGDGDAQLPLQQVDQFVAGVIHVLAAAAAVDLDGTQKGGEVRIAQARGKGFGLQVTLVVEHRPGPFPGFGKDDFMRCFNLFHKIVDAFVEHFAELQQNLHGRRGQTPFNARNHVGGDPGLLRQIHDGQIVFQADGLQFLADQLVQLHGPLLKQEHW